MSNTNGKTATEIEGTLINRTTSREKVLAFFCTLISPEALNDVGELPSEFQDGLGADDAWCLDAARKGYRVEVVSDAFAEHRHSYTFEALGIDRSAAQAKAVSLLATH